MANLENYSTKNRKQDLGLLNSKVFIENETLTDVITKFANEAKLPENDFVRKSLIRTANTLDHISCEIGDIGKDACKKSAEIASKETSGIVSKAISEVTRKEISAGIGRIIFRLDALKFGAILASLCAVGYIGVMIGRGMDINTPLGPMPRDMAQSLALQDWTIQYATCRPQPANSGVEWCLMPYVKSISIPR